jgi:hypothetical protein
MKRKITYFAQWLMLMLIAQLVFGSNAIAQRRRTIPKTQATPEEMPHPKPDQVSVAITEVIWTGAFLDRAGRLDDTIFVLGTFPRLGIEPYITAGKFYEPLGTKMLLQSGPGMHGMRIKNNSTKTISSIEWLFGIVQTTNKGEKYARDYVFFKDEQLAEGLTIKSGDSQLVFGAIALSRFVVANMPELTSLKTRGVVCIARIVFNDGTEWKRPDNPPNITELDTVLNKWLLKNDLIMYDNRSAEAITHFAVMEEFRARVKKEALEAAKNLLR